jgi:hypothetical protein
MEDVFWDIKSSSYFTGDTLHLRYRAQPVEVFTAMTMKNAVYWIVTPSGSCKNRRFGGTNASIFRVH